MVRSPSSYNRAKPRLKPQPRVLVLCEDQKSGRQYLEDACLNFRVHVDVEVAHCGKTDPKGIVTEAIRRKKKFEHVFCAIDRDTHANFDEAIRIANASQMVTVIASYPCFEFWLLLHFSYSRKPYAREGSDSPADVVVRDLRMCAGMNNYAKGNASSVFQALLGKLPEARVHARRALDDAEHCGELNPSTTMHELLNFLESLALPQTI